MTNPTERPRSPYERDEPPRYDVQTWRKVAYYGGAVLQGVGVVMFFSVFFSFFRFFRAMSSTFGTGSAVDGPHFMSPLGMFPFAFVGILLIGAGQWVRNVGKRGLAGSGVILSPEGEARDAEPWKRSEGAQDQDRLEEVPILRDAVARLGSVAPDVRVRCPKCAYVETEDARFCSACGAPMIGGA
ncbi:zinc ribbon domain-containing protein [Actinomyces sp. B33]|uniref:zinc ribbon domain-containing protein n=1 Tax=Actinomyces sp. B33 TaxID=2942131 RepID=UPI00233FFEE6|nr:zinc ribbon domain-containing protein [Actinomyces sp. B33]MDC4233634.1 zinc ribbon domain-containing protein [Actinomyces sp. B33]